MRVVPYRNKAEAKGCAYCGEESDNCICDICPQCFERTPYVCECCRGCLNCCICCRLGLDSMLKNLESKP